MTTAQAITRLVNCIQKNTVISQVLQNFYCACGTSFQTSGTFKDHVLQAHDGLFVKGSSHYISICSQIVLPVTNWKKPSNYEADRPRINNKNRKSTYHQKKNQTVLAQDQHQCTFQTINHQQTKSRQNKSAKSKTKRTNRSLNIKKNQNKEIELEKQQSDKQTLEWNGFIIIPNEKYKNRGFFCGKCQKSLQNKQVFVLHLLNDCFDLQNVSSSHFLRLQEDLQKKQQVTGSSLTKLPSKSKRRQNYMPGIDKYCLRAQYRENIPTNLMGIYQLLLKKAESDKEEFVCGCGCTNRMISSKSYLGYHIGRLHNQIVPLNSSHVIIRAGSGITRIFALKLKIQGQEDEQLIWSCPCRPNSSMNRQTLIKHIMRIHKGISPLYKLLI